MASTSGKSLEQLKAEKKAFEDAGTWNPSKSKSQGKIEDAIKSLDPGSYGAETVASANKKLAISTQVPGTGDVNGGGIDSIFNSSELSGINSSIAELDKQITERQKAKAEQAALINDNPFYAEATRVGKQAKLDEKADRDIDNLINDRAVKESRVQSLKNDMLQTLNIQMQQQQLNRPAVQFSQDAYGNLIKVSYDPNTGNILSNENLGGGKSGESSPKTMDFFEILQQALGNGGFGYNSPSPFGMSTETGEVYTDEFGNPIDSAYEISSLWVPITGNGGSSW